jgi:hypothetical protein
MRFSIVYSTGCFGCVLPPIRILARVVLCILYLGFTVCVVWSDVHYIHYIQVDSKVVGRGVKSNCLATELKFNFVCYRQSYQSYP